MPGGVGVAAIVLLVVFVIGVAAGSAKGRLLLFLVGIVAIAVIGFVVAGGTGGAGRGAAAITRLYTIALPPLLVFVAGWLCARGSWFTRIVVVAVTALLLAAFPYPAVGQATADFLAPAARTR